MDSTTALVPLSKLRSFYESAQLDRVATPSLNFRHFRFRLENGSFYKVRRKIRKLEALRKYLVRMTPLDVYYSAACWLNPELLASRVNREVLKNIMLSCDLAFDIDIGEELKTLDDARKQTVILTEFLTSEGIEIRYRSFSGSKGFHVICEDPWKDICKENPKEREVEAIKKRKWLVSKAKAEGLVFDEKVTIDPRRIIRLPGTLNSSTGFVCTILSQEQLGSSTAEILKYARLNSPIAPWIQVGDDKVFQTCKIHGLMGREGVRPKPEPKIYYSTFLSSNIPKTRLNIPILEFDCQWKMQNILAVAKNVQDKYGLGNLYILSDGDKITAISLKAVCRRRVEKILFAAGSLNLSQSKKYGCTYTRVGMSLNSDGTIARREPQLIITLRSKLRGQASRPHSECLASIGIEIDTETTTFCGPEKEALDLIHTVME